MNEKIKELMGKTLDSEFSHTWNTMTYEGLLQFSEKFALLIIQECFQACMNEGESYEEKAAGAYQSNLYVTAIKQHFGVEE